MSALPLPFTRSPLSPSATSLLLFPLAAVAYVGCLGNAPCSFIIDKRKACLPCYKRRSTFERLLP